MFILSRFNEENSCDVQQTLEELFSCLAPLTKDEKLAIFIPLMQEFLKLPFVFDVTRFNQTCSATPFFDQIIEVEEFEEEISTTLDSIEKGLSLCKSDQYIAEQYFKLLTHILITWKSSMNPFHSRVMKILCNWLEQRINYLTLQPQLLFEIVARTSVPDPESYSLGEKFQTSYWSTWRILLDVIEDPSLIPVEKLFAKGGLLFQYCSLVANGAYNTTTELTEITFNFLEQVINLLKKCSLPIDRHFIEMHESLREEAELKRKTDLEIQQNPGSSAARQYYLNFLKETTASNQG
jgi:hypothetical protein